MKTKVWITRALYGIFLLGTTGAAALWIGAMTAKCEGFGCLGVGAIVFMAVAVQFVCAIAGGALMWLQGREGKVPRWLIILEALHALPVLWFAARMALA